ncbi:MAG: biopolymer transporter ExbD [Bdellovibrionota bacterium]
MRASILQKMKIASPIKEMARIQAKGGGKKEKSLFFSLNLTTLIDAFCILVIFLLSNMNGQLKNLEVSKNMILPSAKISDTMADGLVVKIENNELVVNDKKISRDDIAAVLLKAKTSETLALIIQADRKSDYENIGLVLRAGGQAGYEKYVFAVLPGT